MDATATPPLVVFIVYFATMWAIGMLVYQRNNTLADFVLGGRSLNTWVAARSTQANDMSGFILIDLPGAAYTGGLGAVGSRSGWPRAACCSTRCSSSGRPPTARHRADGANRQRERTTILTT